MQAWSPESSAGCIKLYKALIKSRASVHMMYYHQEVTSVLLKLWSLIQFNHLNLFKTPKMTNHTLIFFAQIATWLAIILYYYGLPTVAAGVLKV